MMICGKVKKKSPHQMRAFLKVENLRISHRREVDAKVWDFFF